MADRILLFLFFLSFGLSGWAQSPLNQRVTIAFADEPLEQALYRLLDETKAPIFFSNAILPQKTIRAVFRNKSLREVLAGLLVDTDLEVRQVQDDLVIVRTVPPPAPAPTYTISGYIEDYESGETLVSASLLVANRQQGVSSNDYGFFSTTVTEGAVTLVASYLGYSTLSTQFNLRRDTFIRLRLRPDLTLLTEVIITANDSLRSNTRDDLFGFNLSAYDLPRFGGERDLQRSLQLNPGVQTGTDGVGGIFVRGGDAGHNLVLIDGVPVYNSNHAAGLLSVFNNSALKSVRLIKGGFPARYGGRLASVIDVRTRDGNRQRLAGEGEIGLLSARATLEGPLDSARGAFLLSGRWSVINAFLEPYVRRYKASRGETGASRFSFYDFHAKLNYDLGPRDRLLFSFYQGGDVFRNFGSRQDSAYLLLNNGSIFQSNYSQQYDENSQWGNRVGALRWNHLVNPQLFANLTVAYSQLAIDLTYENHDTLAVLLPRNTISSHWHLNQYRSGIGEIGLKADLDWIPAEGWTHHFGGALMHHTFQPGALEFRDLSGGESGNPPWVNRQIKAASATAYWETEQRLSGGVWMLNYGLHAAAWQVEQRLYSSLQPRFAAAWHPAQRWTWRGSLSRMTQFVHLLTSSNLALPTDIWVPSTKAIRPENAWQVTLGGEWANLQGWQFSWEAYYKWMNNLVTYAEGSSFLNDWEQSTTTGSGKARGIDFSLGRMSKANQWQISYSLAWADRRFPLFNLGDPYPFKYDRRHDLKVLAKQNIGSRLSLQATWLFSTGLAFSLPIEAYTVQFPGIPPVVVLDYGGKNQFRLPQYHRLDLGLTWVIPSQNRWEHQLYLGIYNAYNRQNPLYYQLRSTFDLVEGQVRERKELEKVNLLPRLPAINYLLRF